MIDTEIQATMFRENNHHHYKVSVPLPGRNDCCVFSGSFLVIHEALTLFLDEELGPGWGQLVYRLDMPESERGRKDNREVDRASRPRDQARRRCRPDPLGTAW